MAKKLVSANRLYAEALAETRGFNPAILFSGAMGSEMERLYLVVDSIDKGKSVPPVSDSDTGKLSPEIERRIYAKYAAMREERLSQATAAFGKELPEVLTNKVSEATRTAMFKTIKAAIDKVVSSVSANDTAQAISVLASYGLGSLARKMIASKISRCPAAQAAKVEIGLLAAKGVLTPAKLAEKLGAVNAAMVVAGDKLDFLLMPRVYGYKPQEISLRFRADTADEIQGDEVTPEQQKTHGCVGEWTAEDQARHSGVVTPEQQARLDASLFNVETYQASLQWVDEAHFLSNYCGKWAESFIGFSLWAAINAATESFINKYSGEMSEYALGKIQARPRAGVKWQEVVNLATSAPGMIAARQESIAYWESKGATEVDQLDSEVPMQAYEWKHTLADHLRTGGDVSEVAMAVTAMSRIDEISAEISKLEEIVDAFCARPHLFNVLQQAAAKCEMEGFNWEPQFLRIKMFEKTFLELTDPANVEMAEARVLLRELSQMGVKFERKEFTFDQYNAVTGDVEPETVVWREYAILLHEGYSVAEFAATFELAAAIQPIARKMKGMAGLVASTGVCDMPDEALQLEKFIDDNDDLLKDSLF